ncbi:gamma-glutamyltransferase family protein [Natronorubrum daqingense]|uniref:Gamma-glutamyltransferase n=1 Tax=Natronorubrum daqingense TaxID=588898 RepID=A0A1N7DPC2_9EURY|nr:gamma-glutamyltransferase family protein [Natronorubrum daqingense]APX96088.1 gamma-glutamyltransferase [Natronorubrum daqingense]SIR77555.1 gamma-glutamyltranspeptidase / glutathione hydrolase [Natronorubrum daqingense]
MTEDFDLDRFDSRRSTVYGNRGMVSTSQPLAAQAGVSILQNGGNAFDAAVATAAALNVVEPTSTGLGGDVFALYRTADGEVGAMRSCGGAPADATIENVRGALEDTDSETLEGYYPESRGYAVDSASSADELGMPFLGPHAVTVPGTARGWETTVQELGRLTLGDVLEPAIEYATEGFPVSPVISYYWEGAKDLFTDENAREAYLFDGDTPDAGETVTLPQLGESMRTIAEDGADAFYEGEIADAIVEEIQSAGGFLTHEDLASFEPEFVDPVSTTYNGAEVWELPPNNQGLVALEALNIAEEIGAGDHPYDSPERVHAFAEAMKLAFVDGHHYITDPEFEEIPPLASKSYARERARGIGETPIQDPEVGVPNANAEDADTVLLTVGDEDGNLVSYINSRFAGFGSGLVAGETGIALQNRGASFSLDSSHPNSLEPGKRPFHTLVPAIAKFDADDWAAFGVMGGYMQPQGHVQVISNIVDYGMTPQAALDAPRWRYRESGSLGVEDRLSQLPKLARMGHDVDVLTPVMFGGAQLVRYRDGTLAGATEPRKDGNAIGY